MQGGWRIIDDVYNNCVNIIDITEFVELLELQYPTKNTQEQQVMLHQAQILTLNKLEDKLATNNSVVIERQTYRKLQPQIHKLLEKYHYNDLVAN